MSRYISICLVVIASILPLAAQTSSLQGNVKDGQNAIIPFAVISLTNIDTGATRQILSGEDGTYNFLQMSPGNYRIEAKLPGFSVFKRDVRLQIDTPATLNVALEIGEITTSVSVTAEAPLINTSTASMGTPFTETQIRQLPLQTRNIVDLLGLQAGVSSGGNVAGAKSNQNNVTLDGVDVNDSQAAGGAFNSVLAIPLDSVQEFRTTIAGQGADQGRSSGGQVSVVTKSGSNSFHGSLYEFNRNTSLAANSWFSNRAGIPREKLIRNQYGASFGGPVVKNRAFFFLSWEERKDRSEQSQSRIVPTASFKQGFVSVRTNNGGIQTFSPSEIVQIDPIHAPANAYILNMLQAYPEPNDLLTGGDRGLNLATFRFNAPKHLDYRTLVGKMNVNLDTAGRHILAVRGTYMDNAEDGTLAQFPGESAVSKSLENSRGIATTYTAVLSPTLINVFNYGLTRLGTQDSGVGGSSVSFSTALLAPFPRASVRISPTHNIVDDITWVKGKHSMQFGLNFRFIKNDRIAYNNYPSYSLSRNTLKGLGNDITGAVTAFMRSRAGSSNMSLTETTQVANAFGTLFGVVNSYNGTYQYNIDGSVVPFGSPVPRSFANNEWEFYAQDSWKVRRDLTVTAGLRYSLFPAPYETNGVQVSPTTGVDVFFSERILANQLGIAGNAMPHSVLTFEKAGPVNGGRPYYNLDTNNFAPRVSLAYAPQYEGLLGKLFGEGSALRAGFAVTYDRYGGNMAVSFANTGSPGLTYRATQPLNTDFTDSFRYQGTALPLLPAAPSGVFPFTPPDVAGGFGSFATVNPNLVAPYTYLLNATYARPLPGKMTLELGYVGRMSHKMMLTQDYFQPLTRFLDTKSGMTWTQASGVLRDAIEAGITPAQVKANPGVLSEVPFFENMFPAAAGTAAGTKTAGSSATDNYFYTVYNTYAGSDLDALHDFDRVVQSNGKCLSVSGCYTFFARQNAGLPTWTNADNPVYHGATIVVRRALQRGWGFDFNYTFSKSLDIASGGTGDSAGIQDTFNPKQSRSYSTFDARHNITANAISELPFGRGKILLGNPAPWLDQIVGGWQLSMLGRFRTGQPVNVSTGGVYPTNYLSSSLAILKPGATMPEPGLHFNANGNPALYPLDAVSSFYGQYPGTTGSRGILRGPKSMNVDLSLAKTFHLPKEGHQLQLRGEAFNAFNLVNFTGLSATVNTPTTFGQVTGTSEPRVVQFGLRYEF
jgi:hypothetical protein